MRKWIDYSGRALRGVAFGLTVMCAAAGAHAQAMIESITGSIQGGTEVIRIDLSEPLSSVPAGFVVQAPARVALDCPGVRSGLAQNQVELGQGNARTANVV